MMPSMIHRWPIALAALLAVACSSTDQYRVQIQVPRRAEIRLADFAGIAVTEFLPTSDAPDFAISREIRDYLSSELSEELEEPVEQRDIVPPDIKAFDNQDFWKTLSPESKKTVIFSGTTEFSAETRKALIAKERKDYGDPFPRGENLETRKFFSLTMHVYLLDSESGLKLYDQEFKESRAYSNPNQTGYFAFFDLLFEIKEKLFREIMGGAKMQDRYLLIH
jgi:hypothetical protein